MSWKNRIENWLKKLNLNGIGPTPLEISQPDKFEKVKKIGEKLGAPMDAEVIGMLLESGLNDDQILEIITATNLLNCQGMGDLTLEIEKMFAQRTLYQYAYYGLEQFNQALNQYHEKNFSK